MGLWRTRRKHHDRKCHILRDCLADDLIERGQRHPGRLLPQHSIMIMRGMGRCGTGFPILRALYPSHFCPDRAKGLTPDTCPGQSGEQQDQHKARNPETDDSVQIAPEQALSAPQSWPDNSGKAPSLRPPKVEPCQDHDDGPACRQFNDPVANSPDHQRTMYVSERWGDAAFGVQTAQYLALRRDENVAHRFSVGHREVQHCRIAGLFRQAIAVKLCSRKRAHGGCQVHICRNRTIGVAATKGTFFPPFDLRFEQIGRSGHRQQHHKGQNEQAGVEMPAPDRAIKSCLIHHPAPFRTVSANRQRRRGVQLADRWQMRR